MNPLLVEPPPQFSHHFEPSSSLEASLEHRFESQKYIFKRNLNGLVDNLFGFLLDEVKHVQRQQEQQNLQQA